MVAATAYVLISVRVSLGIAREGISARRSALEWAVAYPTSDSSTEQTTERFDDQAVDDHVKVPLPSSDAAVPLHRSGQTGKALLMRISPMFTLASPGCNLFFRGEIVRILHEGM